MGGFSGFFSKNIKHSDIKDICQKMCNTLIHRGPDDEGIWIDNQTGVALCHRRLAIQDLSPKGHQPMASASGRFLVVFDGEIYNFIELKMELEKTGVAFRGHSDTEVLLASIERWGVKAALEKFIGMFAFALWDRWERILIFARDRIGEKPLYYGWQGNTFLFGSELKALRVHPEWQGEINRDVLALYMRHCYIPAPYSIYKGIFKLLPGTILHLPIDIPSGTIPNCTSYWNAKAIVEHGAENHMLISDEEAIERLDGLLRCSIREKMLADVPLGALLSGGIDSSTVVALMQAESSRPIKTFSIGFHEEGYNEAEQAKLIARHLGTEHTELYVTAKQAMDVIPMLPNLYDEPFSDSSQIPTFLVCEMARRHVTVALSGDGGDELFGGYNRYFLGRSIWARVGWIPKPFCAIGARILTSVSPSRWDKIFKISYSFFPSRMKQRFPGNNLHKLASILAIRNPDEMYYRLVSHWENPCSLVINSSEPLTMLTDPSRRVKLDDFTKRMMFLDAVSGLPDDSLCKVDRVSMGVSLEVRAPMIDHRVVEFAWQLPLSMRIRKGQSKWLLRQILYKYVPRNIMERPKMGFCVPIDIWLRGPLREWGEELLREVRLKRDGFFNPLPIREKWKEHLSGKKNWQHHLWAILMFQAWLTKKGQ